MKELDDLLINVRVFDEPEHLAENRLFGLFDLINTTGINKESIVVEIGAYSGTTSKLFSLYAKEVQVYNTWKLGDQTSDAIRLAKAERLFDAVVSEREPVIVKHTCNTLVEAANIIENKSADVLYLGHLLEYRDAMDQLKAFTCKVKPGGYITGHGLHHPGVKQAVCEFLEHGYQDFHDYSFAFQLPAEAKVVVNPVEISHIIESVTKHKVK